jgi:hypothetical protein
MRLAFLIAVILFATPSFAARLLLPEDAPVTAAPSATTTTAATASPPAERHEPPSFGIQFGVAAAAGMVGAPVGFLLASALGNLSAFLIPTAILGLVPLGLFAPVLTALAGWLVGNWNLTDADGKFSFWLGFAAAAVVHIIGSVIAGFAGVTLGLIPGLILFSVIDGAAMGAASVGTMRFFRKVPAPTAFVVPSFSPAVSATTVVPITAFAF